MRTEDRAIPPGLQRAFAARIGPVVEWPTSHSPFLSRPELVTALLADQAHAATLRIADVSTLDEYVAKARTALEQLRGQLDELRVQADLAQADAHDRIQAGIASVQKAQANAKTQLDQAAKSGQDTWKSTGSRPSRP